MLHNKAGAGFVQADILRLAERTEPLVRKNIFSLVGLHTNYMYIFTLKDGVKKNRKNVLDFFAGKVIIKDFRQLANRPVALFGSAQTTIQFVNQNLNAGLKLSNVNSKEEGFAKLSNGEVDSFVVAGGKYVPWIENEVDGNKFSLVRVSSEDIAILQSAKLPYFLGKINYKQFGAIGVGAICVQNELVCLNYTGSRKQDLLSIRNYLIAHSGTIKEAPNANASWLEIDNDALNSSSWQRYCPGQ